MNVSRKVFVATKLPPDSINQSFQWPDGFERADSLDDAEFIVVDLVNLPSNWVGFPWNKQAIYVPKQNLPILFIALEDKIAPQFDDIKNYFQSIDLPVYKSQGELFKALQWLQSIFPFYNQTRTPDIDQETARAALAAVKAKLNKSQ